MPENINELAFRIIANADSLLAGTRKAQTELEKTGVSATEAGQAIDRAFAKMGVSAEEAANVVSQVYRRTAASAEAAATATTAAADRGAAGQISAAERAAAAQIGLAERVEKARMSAAERAAVAEVLAQDRVTAATERSAGVRLSVIQAAIAKEKFAFEETSALQSAMAGKGTTLLPDQKLAFADRMAAAKTLAAEEMAANKAVADAFKRDTKARMGLMFPGIGTVEEEEARAQRASRQGSGGTRMASVLSGGANFAANMAAGITGIGFAAAKMAADYETKMLTVKNNTMMSNKEFEEMKRVVNDLGMASGAPLDKLAEGFRHISDFGFHGSDATQVLTASMKAAVSTGADVGETSQLVAKVLREYGMSANQATAATNKLWYASANSDQTFKDLITSGRQALATGSKLGVNFNQVAAALSVFTSQGLNASQSATQVVNLMNKITTPTVAVRKELEMVSKVTRKTIGVDLVQDFSSAGLKAKQFSGIFADVRAAAEQMGIPVDRLAHDLFPNLRGTIGGLIGTSTEGFKGLETRLKAMDGIAVKNPIEAGYQERLQTLTQQWKILSNTITVEFLPVGRDFIKILKDMMPSLKQMAELVAKGMDAFTRLPGPIKDAVTWMGTLQIATLALGGPLGFGALFKVFERLIKYLTVGIPAAAVVSEGALEGVAAAGAGGAAAGGAVKGGFLLKAGKWALGAAAANPVGAGILATGGAAYFNATQRQRNSEAEMERLQKETPLLSTIHALRRVTGQFRGTEKYDTPVNLLGGHSLLGVGNPILNSLDQSETLMAQHASKQLFKTEDLGSLSPKQWDQLAGKFHGELQALTAAFKKGGAVGEVPPSLKDALAQAGAPMGQKCGEFITAELKKFGFKGTASSIVGTTDARGRVTPRPSTARPTGALDAQGNPIYPQGTIGFFPGRTGGTQHFIRTYLDASHIERAVESTTAGGRGRHVRADRTVAEIQQERGYTGHFYQVPRDGARIPGVGGYNPPVEKSAAERAYDAALAAAKGGAGSRLTEAQREQKTYTREMAGLQTALGSKTKELAGLHLSLADAVKSLNAVQKQSIVDSVAQKYTNLTGAQRQHAVLLREEVLGQKVALQQYVNGEKEKQKAIAQSGETEARIDAAIRKANKIVADDLEAQRKAMLASRMDAMRSLVDITTTPQDKESALQAVKYYEMSQMAGLTDTRERARLLSDIAGIEKQILDLREQQAAPAKKEQERRDSLIAAFRTEMGDKTEAAQLSLLGDDPGARWQKYLAGHKDLQGLGATDPKLLPQLKQVFLNADATQEQAKAQLDSIAVTDRLKEALADSQVKTDKARGSMDYYAAALARLNLVTKPLTTDQKAMVSQIAQADKQAAMVAAHTRLMQNASRSIENIFANSFDAMFKKGGSFFKSLGDGFKNLAQKIVVDWAASKVTGFLTPLLDKGLGLLGLGGKQKNVGGNTAAPIEQASFQAGGAITSGGLVLQRALLGVAAGIGGASPLALAGGATLPGLGIGMGGGGGLFPGLTLPSLTQGGLTAPFNPKGSLGGTSDISSIFSKKTPFLGKLGAGLGLAQGVMELFHKDAPKKHGLFGKIGGFFGKALPFLSMIPGMGSFGLISKILGGMGGFGGMGGAGGGGIAALLAWLRQQGIGGGGTVPMFADGGNFMGNKGPILVGEKGPELILPKHSGSVISNREILQMMRGGHVGGRMLNITVHHTHNGDIRTQMDIDELYDNLGRTIEKRIRSGLQNDHSIR